MTSEDNQLINAYWRLSDAIDDITEIDPRSEVMQQLYQARNLFRDCLPDTDIALPQYDPETDGDYHQWLVSNNID